MGTRVGKQTETLFNTGDPVMTLKKSDIVNSISNHVGFTKRQSVETVESLLEIIKQSLESGKDVLISGFGKFCVKDKRERRGRNPARATNLSGKTNTTIYWQMAQLPYLPCGKRKRLPVLRRFQTFSPQGAFAVYPDRDRGLKGVLPH